MLGFSLGTCKAAIAEHWKAWAPLPADGKRIGELDLLADMDNQQYLCVYI